MPQGIPGTFRGDKPLLEHPETRAVALQASSSIIITESADQSSSEVPSITAEPSSRLSACLTFHHRNLNCVSFSSSSSILWPAFYQYCVRDAAAKEATPQSRRPELVEPANHGSVA